MIGKLFSILMTFVIGKMAGQPATPSSMVGLSVAMMRKISIGLALFAVSSVLFLGGFMTILVDLILASYTLGQVTLTSLSWVGFGLILAACLGYAITFADRFWRPVARPEIYTSPVNAALANLINDFVTERRIHRAAAPAGAGFGVHNGDSRPGAETRRAYMS